MIALLQRVTQAQVSVAGSITGAIDAGLLVLWGVERGDGDAQAARLVERLVNYRVFADANGKMNLSLRQTGGGLLLVPQFTLAADTRHGTRPGFSSAAAPADAQRLFELAVTLARSHIHRVHTGVFGADMQVSSCNNGPVTFWLQVPPGQVGQDD